MGGEEVTDDRYAPDTDDLFEEKLRRCREQGHDFKAFWQPSGELLVCERCEAVFTEQAS